MMAHRSMEDIVSFEEDSWNDDIADDLSPENFNDLVVFSRDWTVETVVSQITKGNIDLQPDFQRRNAWNDSRRSLLIESLILGIPVPEVVLATTPDNSKSFIVIDGKQRLLAILGYTNPELIHCWDSDRLQGLRIRSDLNSLSFADLETTFPEDHDALMNADIRCTVISNYRSDDTLYHIFYRLNTGSVPLSTQELRQSLNKGPFSKYILVETGKIRPIHAVLRLDEPDKRMRDAELLLRFIAFHMYGKRYRGNLKKFLDDATKQMNAEWADLSEKILEINKTFDDSITRLLKVLGDKIGRRFLPEKGIWETRFNKALFEVEAFLFSFLSDKDITLKSNQKFERELKSLFSDAAFTDTIGATTKTVDRYHSRFALFQKAVNRAYGKKLDFVPITRPSDQ